MERPRKMQMMGSFCLWRFYSSTKILWIEDLLSDDKMTFDSTHGAISLNIG